MDIHNLEASVTAETAVSILPKIKTWRIAYRLPLFTLHLLSFSAPSVFFRINNALFANAFFIS